jgi:glucose/arabinose dehydrogenase
LKKSLLFLTLLFLGRATAFAQVVMTETLCTGLLYPVCIVNSGLPTDQRLFVLEKRGRIKIVDRNTGAVTPTPFLDIYSRVYPITSVNDERGLLGMAFDPDYANNGFFYLNYVNTLGKTVIARYQVSPFPDTAFKYSEQIMLTIFQPYSNHKGGNLMFGPDDGYLYISQGDGGSAGDPANRAQNVDTLLGKMLRIDVKNPSPPYYFPAPGNPFYGPTPGRDEIFNWGLRNPWRCSFDRLTHDLWIADVGQGAQEEIDFRPKCDTAGHNYGWRCYEGNAAYNTAGCQMQSSYEAPVFVYTHTLGCSVTGGYVYRGAKEGGLFGQYLFSDYCQGRFWATSANGSGGWNTVQLAQSTPQINNNYSSFGEDIYGELYLATVASGRIYRLKDTACAPVAFIDAPDTLFYCGSGAITFKSVQSADITYSWSVSGVGSWSVAGSVNQSTVSVNPDVNGEGKIWLSTSDGTCSANSKTITVITGVTINSLQSVYCLTDPPLNLKASLPGGVFGGPGVSGNIFTPYNAVHGVNTIIYTITDSISSCNGKKLHCALTATASLSVINCADGLSGQRSLHDLRIYPNPSNGLFTVGFYNVEQNDVVFTVSDALGRIVEKGKIIKSKNDPFILDLRQNDPGIYFMEIDLGKAKEVRKLVFTK